MEALRIDDATLTVDALRDWVLAGEGQSLWLGRPSPAALTANWGSAAPFNGMLYLSPAYVVLGQWQAGQTSQGVQVTRNRLVVPVEYLASAREALIRAGSIIPLRLFDVVDLGNLHVAVMQAEKMRGLLQAQRSGLVMASSLPAAGPGLAKAPRS